MYLFKVILSESWNALFTEEKRCKHQSQVLEVSKPGQMVEGSLEVKLPRIWTDGKGGKSQRGEERSEKIREETK